MPRKNDAKGKPEQGQEKKLGSTKKKHLAKTSADESFPIVGIGASAGGLEAFTQFLDNLPVVTGMAFVFVQHLAAGQESLLTDILSRSTPMPVHKVENGMEVHRNNVYVIPPNVSMTIVDHVLKLQPQVSKLHRSYRPVSNFAG
jgi:two-component system CheB/CheR fusion protein